MLQKAPAFHFSLPNSTNLNPITPYASSITNPFATSNDTGTASPPSTGDSATVLCFRWYRGGSMAGGVMAWFRYDTNAESLS